MSKVRCKPLKF